LGAWVLGGCVLLVAAGLVLIGEDLPKRLVRGDAAPGFILPLVAGTGPAGSGDWVDLEALRGRVVLLNFWATWCEPCEDEMPSMQRLYDRLAPRGFELVAVSVDEDPAAVEAFRERLGLRFPIALDPESEIAKRYQTMGFPESLLIGPEGDVIERYVGPRDWDAPMYSERIARLLPHAG
jgi:cytochrome c biogenesis protein CcmG/thiol:disulfide interchange protein DsbE